MALTCVCSLGLIVGEETVPGSLKAVQVVVKVRALDRAVFEY